jgi:hypothetical protein
MTRVGLYRLATSVVNVPNRSDMQLIRPECRCRRPGPVASGLPGVLVSTGVREDGRMADEAQPTQSDSRAVLVMGPDGTPLTAMTGSDSEDPARLIEQPAKVMRIGSMIKQLLEEVRAAPLDEAGRQRLKEIHRRSITELEDGLAPELRDELERLTLPFDESTPTEPELRIAQAQLVGWLEGLFHGIQAALVAQQVAARVQLEQMRTGRPALPPGVTQMPGQGGVPGAEGPTGQYL